MSERETEADRHIVGSYRLQLHEGFTFADAERVVPYLAELGISHLYLSPPFEAVAGSTHGYDVVDPTAFSSALGGERGFRALAESCRGAGVRIIVDIVPHHMAATPANRWWRDVLQFGRDSSSAEWFDIDWGAEADGRLLLPILGDHIGVEIGEGRVRVVPDEDGDELVLLELAGSTRLPLSPETVAEVLAGVAKDDTASLLRRLEALNADPDRLLALVDAQHYRPARWRMADHELGYRRFFDVDSLVALRTSDPAVFERSHRLVRRLVDEGLVDGLRVDHVDGLRDPWAYSHALRSLAPDAWIGVEKILVGRERLQTSWPVEGTTGYDAAAVLTPFLVDPRGEAALDELYRARSGDDLTFDEHARLAREEVADSLLGSDVARLTNLLHELLLDDPRHRDTSVEEARRAVVAVVSSFPRYRTYVRARDDGSPDVSAADRHVIQLAVTTAAEHHPELDPALLEFIAAALTLETSGTAAVEFALRFQQLSGPVMAKGVEDTALYRSTRLLALNDVGHDPATFSVRPETVHWWAAQQARSWPRSMLTTSTHDTKRSEDVRARLAVLAEDPAGWAEVVQRLDAVLAPVLPDAPGVEWFVYQTAFGAWPIAADRLWPVVLKSIREAKQRTSWLAPDEELEAAVQRFVEALTSEREARTVLDEYVRRIGPAGRANSLALLTLRATLPGFPDTYQGTELWDDSLVDPDNRRPVDFDLRRSLLVDAAAGGGVADDRGEDDARWVACDDPGRTKLSLLHALLGLRRRHPACFTTSVYRAIEVEGPEPSVAIAFRRGDVLVVVPRFPLTGGELRQTTTVQLPRGSWHDVMTGTVRGPGAVSVAALTEHLPVAVLERAR
ncbi:MAG: malto-oligosyltrehalose synthase [Acidimicrobiia bacterium]